jgi:hypothetical protein
MRQGTGHLQVLAGNNQRLAGQRDPHRLQRRLRQRRQVRQCLVPDRHPVAVRSPQQVGHRFAADPRLGHILLRHLGYMHRPCTLHHTAQHNGMNGTDTFTTRYRLGYNFRSRTTHTCRSAWITPAQGRRNFGLASGAATIRSSAIRAGGRHASFRERARRRCLCWFAHSPAIALRSGPVMDPLRNALPSQVGVPGA